MEADKLLTVQDLAAWLQKPVSWIYRHTTESCPPEKRLPAVRLDRGLRFQRHEIQRWLDAHSTCESGGQVSRESVPETRFPGSRDAKSSQVGAKTPKLNGNQHTFSESLEKLP
jgi:predicted DNA-binding transcriptional regulator AlpA